MEDEDDLMGEMSEAMAAGFLRLEMLLASGDTVSSKLNRSEEQEELAATVEQSVSDVLVVWGQEASTEYDVREATERQSGVTHQCGVCESSTCRGGIACVSDVDTLTSQWTAMFHE